MSEFDTTTKPVDWPTEQFEAWLRRIDATNCDGLGELKNVIADRLAALRAALAASEARVAELDGLLIQAREAIRLTREYVEPNCSLPAIPGWSWYDATVAIDAALREETR